MAISQEQRLDLLTLAVGLFDAAPSASLLEGLSTGIEAGATLDQYATTMGESDEFTSIYPDTQTNAQFAEAFVANLLGQYATEETQAAGEQSLLDALTSGLSKGQAAYATVLLLQDGTDVRFADAQSALENKVAVANSFGTSAQYSGATFAQMGEVLENVDATSASVDQARAAIVAGDIIDVTPGGDGNGGEGNNGQYDNEVRLTASTDRGGEFDGTDGRDLFNSWIEQNSFAGGVSNSLSSADHLDGGASYDTLEAELIPEFFSATGNGTTLRNVQPHTNSIEEVKINADDSGYDSVNEVVLDAENMLAVDRIGSWKSDADLVIDDLTTLQESGLLIDARNTSELTIVMDHTAGDRNNGLGSNDSDYSDDAADLTVYIDEDYLIAGRSADSTSIQYEVMNMDAFDLIQDGKQDVELLDGVQFDRLNFELDGTTYELAPLLGEDADNTGTVIRTHQDLVDAMNSAIAELGLSDKVSAVIDGTFVQETAGGANSNEARTAPAVKIVAQPGSVLTANENLVYLQPSDSNPTSADGTNVQNSARYDRADQFFSAGSDERVSIDVELYKVGRDADGGNLVIGGKGQGNTDTDVDQKDGVPIFNISVRGTEDHNSNLGKITSTNQALDVVNVENDSDWDGAALTVRNLLGQGQELSLIDARDFSGDFSLAMSDANGQQAVTSYFGAGNDSYNWTSSEANSVSSGNEYIISMGAGNDTVTAALDGDSVDALGETFTLSTGSGEDTVTITADDSNSGGNGVSQQTMDELDNINVNLGGNDDTLLMDNYFNANINAGDGNDLVFMEEGTTASQVIGDVTGAQSFGDRVLYNAELTLSFAGFEQTVSIPTTSSNGYVADQAMINEAVMNAINTSPVLSKLISATLIEGTQALRIDTITEDGLSAVSGGNSLAIAIYQPQLVEATAADGEVVLSSSDLSALERGFIETTSLDSDDFTSVGTAVTAIGGLDVSLTNGWSGAVNENGVGNTTNYTEINNDVELARGANATDILDAAADNYLDYTVVGSDSSTGVNLSTIEMGKGNNDIVVMHSNDANAGVLKFTEEFGKVSVVNWHDVATHTVTAATDMGMNALDFTELLDNQTDPSSTTNTNSAVDVTRTTNIVANAEAVTGLSGGVSNNGTAVANSLNVIRFAENATDSFASLDAATLVAALNGNTAATNYGNLTDTLLSPATAAGGIVIGGTAKHIIMVENDQNEGEYKVFYIESDDNSTTNTDADFTVSSAKELGTIDFGASINVQQVGSTAFESYVDNLEKAIDDNAATFTYDVDGNGTVDAGEGETNTPSVEDSTGDDNTDEVSIELYLEGASQIQVTGATEYTVNSVETVGGITTVSVKVGDKDYSEDFSVSEPVLRVNASQTATVSATSVAGVQSVAGAGNLVVSDVQQTTDLDAKVAVTGTVTAQITDVDADLTAAAHLDVVDQFDLGQAVTTDLVVSEAQSSNLINIDATDVITVTGVTSANFETVTDLLSDNDTVKLDAATTLTAENYVDAFTTKGISATAGDSITVDTLTGTVAATAANDTFDFAGSETDVVITGYATANDSIDLVDASLTSETITDTSDLNPASLTDGGFYLLTTTGADATAVSDVETAIAAIDSDGAAFGAAGTAFFAIADDDSTAIYTVTKADASVVAAGDLQLVGTVDAVLDGSEFTLSV